MGLIPVADLLKIYTIKIKYEVINISDFLQITLKLKQRFLNTTSLN